MVLRHVLLPVVHSNNIIADLEFLVNHRKAVIMVSTAVDQVGFTSSKGQVVHAWSPCWLSSFLPACSSRLALIL